MASPSVKQALATASWVVPRLELVSYLHFYRDRTNQIYNCGLFFQTIFVSPDRIGEPAPETKRSRGRDVCRSCCCDRLKKNANVVSELASLQPWASFRGLGEKGHLKFITSSTESSAIARSQPTRASHYRQSSSKGLGLQWNNNNYTHL